MEHVPINTATLHCKFHPDLMRPHLKRFHDMIVQFGSTPRFFQLNDMDYQIFFDYPERPIERYRTEAGQFQEMLKGYNGNISITTCAAYGDCGKDIVTAIMQDWNPAFLAREVQVKHKAWRTSTTAGLIYIKFRVRLAPEQGRELMRKYVEVEESNNCMDMRVFQLNTQEYITLSTNPYKNVEDFFKATEADMKFFQEHGDVLEITECQAFGDFPTDIMSFGMKMWKPSVVAPEIHF